MKAGRRKRGFTLIEILASTILLAIIVISVAALSTAIRTQRTITQNTVYLSTHNLNCMERIKQMALEDGAQLVDFYGDEVFGSADIYTDVFVEQSQLAHFYVYTVRIESKMREFQQRLTSEYTITSIGQVSLDEEFNTVE